MNKFSIYSKKAALVIRIYCICIIAILLASEIGNIVFAEWDGMVIFTCVSNGIVIIITTILFFFPSKIELISICAGYYAISCMMLPSNPMGLFMYFLAYLSLFLRGYYKKHTKVKNILTILLVPILLLSQLRYGTYIFARTTLDYLGYSFISICVLYLYNQIFLERNQKTEKKLNIAFYPDLTKRDCQWLGKIQQNVKYGAIAIEDHLSVGTVKNRLKKIYDALEVGDKNGFLNKYEDYKIYFDMTEEKDEM